MRENNVRRFAARQRADLSPETLRQIRTMIDEQLKAEPSPALSRASMSKPRPSPPGLFRTRDCPTSPAHALTA